jgi:23S rRNA pseudouridine2457 synthase
MEHHSHYILHKPNGYLSQFIYQKKRNKKLLGELYDFPDGTMAIGRLDEDSEGLLLLTTDGMMSELVRGKTIEKEYYAQVDGMITKEAIEKLQNGVEIGLKGLRYTTQKCRATIITELPDCIGEGKRIRDERHGPTSWISITLTEGKFRQVRKMSAAVGFPTLRLVRVRVGSVHLNLKAGEVMKVQQFKI